MDAEDVRKMAREEGWKGLLKPIPPDTFIQIRDMIGSMTKRAIAMRVMDEDVYFGYVRKLDMLKSDATQLLDQRLYKINHMALTQCLTDEEVIKDNMTPEEEEFFAGLIKTIQNSKIPRIKEE